MLFCCRSSDRFRILTSEQYLFYPAKIPQLQCVSSPFNIKYIGKTYLNDHKGFFNDSHSSVNMYVFAMSAQFTKNIESFIEI